MESSKVFISCLPGDTNPEELLQLLQSHAGVVNVTLATKHKSHQESYCLGYGFATCSSNQQAKKLLDLSDQQRIYYKKRPMIIREFKSGRFLNEEKEQIYARRLYIANIPRKVTTKQLKDVFAPYGTLEALYTVYKPQNKGYKCGYAIYKEQHSAQKAIQACSGIVLNNSRIRVKNFVNKKKSSKPQGFDSISDSEEDEGRAKIDLPEHSLVVQEPIKPFSEVRSNPNLEFPKHRLRFKVLTVSENLKKPPEQEQQKPINSIPFKETENKTNTRSSFLERQKLLRVNSNHKLTNICLTVLIKPESQQVFQIHSKNVVFKNHNPPY